MGKKYLISERQFRLINEDVDPLRAVISLIGVSVSAGGLWALSELLEKFSKRLRAGGHKNRISTRNEKEILLSAYNLAGGKVDTRIPKLENLKIKFDTYCPNQVKQVGTTNFKIETATYIIDANPKNHLSSSILFTGINLETNEEQVIVLKSYENNVVFQSLDSNAVGNFGCSANIVNLFNKNLYRHLVKDLNLNILDFPIYSKSDIKTDF